MSRRSSASSSWSARRLNVHIASSTVLHDTKCQTVASFCCPSRQILAAACAVWEYFGGGSRSIACDATVRFSPCPADASGQRSVRTRPSKNLSTIFDLLTDQRTNGTWLLLSAEPSKLRTGTHLENTHTDSLRVSVMYFTKRVTLDIRVPHSPTNRHESSMALSAASGSGLKASLRIEPVTLSLGTGDESLSPGSVDSPAICPISLRRVKTLHSGQRRLPRPLWRRVLIHCWQ